MSHEAAVVRRMHDNHSMRRVEDRLFARFCRTADPRHLAEVFDRTAKELLRVAAHLTRDRASGEDLVQETFVLAIQNRTRFDGRGGVLAWLLGILANLARRHRRTQRRAVTGDHGPRLDLTSPLAAAEQREFSESVATALRALPEVYRQVLTLHLEHGLNAKQIGEVLGRPAGTVRTQVVRGMDLLRGLLPAGFAAAGGLVLSTERGLAAVRDAVLARASIGVEKAVPLAVVGAGVIGASILMQKLTLGVAAIAAVCGGVWSWRTLVDGTASQHQDDAQSAAALRVSTDATQAPPPGGARDLVRAPTTAPVEATGLASLRVRVQWADGTPAAGVGLFISDGSYVPIDYRPLLGEGLTNAAGEFELDALPAGPVAVTTDRGLSARLRVKPGEKCDVALRLSAGLTIEGEVVDPQNRAVAGAAILMFDSNRFRDRDLTLAHSDGAGGFLIRDVEASSCTLCARMSGMQRSSPASANGIAGSRTKVRLTLGGPAHRLQGRVIDERGTPLSRALVGVAIPRPKMGKGYRGRYYDTHLTRADSIGCFAIDWAPPGDIVLLAQSPGQPESTPRAYARVTVDPTVGPFDLVVRSTPGCSGVMRDEQAQPLADQQVSAFLRADSFGIRGSVFENVGTRTAADGSYRLVGLFPGRWRLYAKFADGKAIEHEVELQAGQEVQWDSIVARGHVQRVRLLHPEGTPLVDWVVQWRGYGPSVWPPGQKEWREVASAFTDADGWAKVEGLATAEHQLFVHRPYKGHQYNIYATLAREGVVATQPEVEVRLGREHLPSARAIGRVLDSNGKALVGTQIIVSPHGGGTQVEVPTDAEGRFTFGPLPPGKFNFGIRAPEHPYFGLGSVELQRDGTHDFGDVRLRAAARLLLRVRGLADLSKVKITTACGNEPARAWYFASPPQAGMFRSEPLPAGDYVVYVQGPRVHPVVRRITLVEGQEAAVDLELRAARPTPLTIQLSEPVVQDGIANGVLTVTDAGGVKILEEAFFENFADLTERLLLRDLALLPGHYVIAVDDYDAKRIARVEVTVPASTDDQPFPIRVQ